MGSLWSTSVESMRESTGFRVRSVANAPAPLRTSPRILRLAQWRRRCPGHPPRPHEADGGSLPGVSADFEALRWFVLPRECLPGQLPADGGYGVSHGAGNPVVSRMLASAPAPTVLDIRGTEEDGE
jgi:hypothetical protein